MFELVEHASGVVTAVQFGGQRSWYRVADADHPQEVLGVGGQSVEDLADQVVGYRTVVAGELGEERFVVGGFLQTEGGQP